MCVRPLTRAKPNPENFMPSLSAASLRHLVVSFIVAQITVWALCSPVAAQASEESGGAGNGACAPAGLGLPSVFMRPGPINGQPDGSWTFGVAGGGERAFGRACLLLVTPGGTPLPWAPCLEGLSGRLGPLVALDGQGLATWTLPPEALNLGLDLRVVVWEKAAPWSAASLSGRVTRPAVSIGPLPFPAGAVVITEFLKDPQAVPDAFGEWFEVYNRSSVVLDLEGWVLSDAGIDVTVLNNLGSGILLAPGARMVFGLDVDPFYNGGAQVDVAYQGMILSNTSDEIILSTPSGVLVDSIAYDDGIEWPDKGGRSAVLHPDQVQAGNNGHGSHWCSSNTVFGAGDRGTPGALNDSCW